jgi:hypothetical protein
MHVRPTGNANLTLELDAFIHGRVSSGAHPTASEIACAPLHQLEVKLIGDVRSAVRRSHQSQSDVRQS